MTDQPLTAENAARVAAGEITIAEYLATDPEGMDKLYLVAAGLIIKVTRGAGDARDIEELHRVADEVGDPAALGLVANFEPEIALWQGRLPDARSTAEARAAHDRLNAAPLLLLDALGPGGG